MDITESLKHNIKCWKQDAESIEEKINFLKGKKEALEDTIECLEIILKENSKSE